jgi:hypothetical protein
MIELFIEGQPVDVNESFSTLLTYAIDDVREFGSKNTAFSKTIVIPGTKRNNKLFGNLFDVTGGNTYDPNLPNQGINFNAAVTASAFIFSSNIQILKGIVRVMEVIIDNGFIEYEIFVTGELGGFASKLGNKKLEELDFSTYDHEFTLAAITGSWDNANAGQGYYYPLIDYGNSSALKHNWKYKTFRPALFAKEFIDKIFEGTGYTYECDLFSTSRFKGLIIPHSQRALTKSSSNYLSVSGSGTYTKVKDVNLSFDTHISLGDFSYSGGYLFTYSGTSVSGDITAVLNVSYTKLFDSKITIVLEKSGVVVASYIIDYGGTTTGSATINLAETGLAITSGDTLKVRAYSTGSITGTRSFTLNVASSTMTYTTTGGAAALVSISLGDIYEINQTIPKNILQKDFISSIIKLWNFYIFEDPLNEKVLKIKPFVDFYTDAASTDWSLKLDRSQPIRIKPMSELNARYYEFFFKDDSDYFNDLYKKRYNLSYGSMVYDSEFEFARETEKIEVIFSGTPLVGYLSEDKVYSTIFKKAGELVGIGEDAVDSNIRLLQAKKITGVSSWDIVDNNGTTILGSYTSYGYAGHFDDPNAPANDIQFGVPKELFFTLATAAINVNQFNVYWSSYMAEITDKDSRLLTGTFKLNYRDIYNLDFSEFIYIDGSLFRLNKIVDFNATNEDTCKVELLKVINKVY